MKLRFVALTIIMFILITPINTKAYVTPNSNVYTQGIYKFEESGVFNANVRLIKGEQTTFLVIEPNQNVVLYIKLILNEEVKLNDLDKDYTICIIGEGQVANNYEKAS